MSLHDQSSNVQTAFNKYSQLQNSSLIHLSNSPRIQKQIPLTRNSFSLSQKQLRAPHEYLPTTRFPHLSSSPAKRYAKPPLLGPPASLARQIDPFHILETSPLKYDLNPYVAQQFVNDLGKIKSRAETGLTWKSQRQVGKLVRRARSMGLIGRWSKLAPVGGLGFNRRSY